MGEDGERVATPYLPNFPLIVTGAGELCANRDLQRALVERYCRMTGRAFEDWPERDQRLIIMGAMQAILALFARETGRVYPRDLN